MWHLRCPSCVVHVGVLVSPHAGIARDPMNEEWELPEKMLALAILLGLAVALIVVPWLLL